MSWLAELSSKTEKEKKFVNCTEVGIPFLALPSATESTGYSGPYQETRNSFLGNGLTLLSYLGNVFDQHLINDSSLTPNTPSIKHRGLLLWEMWSARGPWLPHSSWQLRTAASAGTFSFPFHPFGIDFTRILPCFQIKDAHVRQSPQQSDCFTHPAFLVCVFFHHTKCTHGRHHRRHCYKTLEHLSCLLLPRCTLKHQLISAVWVSTGPAGDSAAHGGECFRVLRTGPNLRVPDFVSLWWSLRICFSNKFPDDALRLVWNHFENLM